MAAILGQPSRILILWIQICNQLPKKSRDTKLYQEIYSESDFLSSFVIIDLENIHGIFCANIYITLLYI